MTRAVIGFAGRIGSGKTTAAMRLVEHWGFQRVRFAGPLKAAMKAIGLTDAEIDGHLKEQPCDLLCGKTPRWAMQSIGTEWGRQLIGEELWINAWRRAVETAPPGPIVADDVRFANEAEAIRAMGGQVHLVARPASTVGEVGHSSERIDFKCDATLLNHWSVDVLHDVIDGLAMTVVDQDAITQSWVGHT